MIDLSLSGRERVEVEYLIAHADDTRLVLRAYALLWLDDGENLAEVSASLKVSRQSVYNWVASWAERATQPVSERLSDAPRTGRPCTAQGIIDPLIDAVVDHSPREFGYRTNFWTAALLQHYLKHQHQVSVSADSVHRAINRLRVRWKRPRHHLALRDPHWRQAKGGLKRGFLSAHGTSS